MSTLSLPNRPTQTELLSKSTGATSVLCHATHCTLWTPARSNRQPRGTFRALQEPLQMRRTRTGSCAEGIQWARSNNSGS